jgi:hypothetical protein
VADAAVPFVLLLPEEHEVITAASAVIADVNKQHVVGHHLSSGRICQHLRRHCAGRY